MQDESRALDSRDGGELETATEIKGLEEQLASGEIPRPDRRRVGARDRGYVARHVPRSWEEER